MPTLMPASPPPAQEVRSLYEITESPYASGREGQELLLQFQNVYRQWNERTISLADHENEAVEHVPFEAAGTIKVRFLPATPMSPRQFNYHELDHE